MNQKDIDKIIREYLNGKDTPEGEALFNTWYDSQNDEASPLKNMSKAQKEKIRQEIFSKAKAGNSAPLQKTLKLPARKAFHGWYRIAAIWIGLLMLGTAYFVYQTQQPNWITYQTDYGEVKNITLPDGSGVTLNANSQLKYAASDENTSRRSASREVWLDGEAYFSVVHTADDQKFRVQTANLNVEVLGTEFNVNNRRGDTEVVLHTGKVKLGLHDNKETPELMMEPGELVAYSANNKHLTKKLVNTENYTHWRNQELILNNTSLAEIARVLEDYYGFEVSMQDKLKDIQLTATATLSLKDTEIILTAISEIYGIEVEKEGKQISFSNP